MIKEACFTSQALDRIHEAANAAYSDIEREALRQAFSNGKHIVTKEHVEAALNRIIVTILPIGENDE